MAHSRPVIDQQAAEKMNLNVLRRMDPQIEELLATAGHVALYDFDIPNKRWSRKEVEGSLFLVKRRSQPRFQFVILNKKSAVGNDNFVEDVHGGFQCEVQRPYVLYRNRANEVVGIWFYDDADCDRISGLLQRIASTFAAPAEAEAGVLQPAAAPVEEEPAASPGGGSEGSGEDAFWDRRVVVDEAADEAQVQQRHANGLLALAAADAGQQPPAAEAGKGGGNDLARLFAGIKVGAAPAAAPAAPAAPAPPTAAPMQLLTPQLLQQEAAASAPAPAPAPEVAAGSVLLRNLLRGAQPAAPAAKPVVDISEAADRVLREKVSTLLSSLANNDAFVGVLASELKRAGLV